MPGNFRGGTWFDSVFLERWSNLAQKEREIALLKTE
jgi:hypothetical protein